MKQIKPRHNRFNEYGWEKLTQCKECKSVGPYMDFMFAGDPCYFCGSARHTECIGKWEEEKWKLKEESNENDHDNGIGLPTLDDLQAIGTYLVYGGTVILTIIIIINKLWM